MLHIDDLPTLNIMEHIIDITRTNRPQFKTNIYILPEYFVDGEIKVPSRGMFNTELREKVAKAREEAKVKTTLLNQLAELPAEQLARLLEMVKK